MSGAPAFSLPLWNLLKKSSGRREALPDADRISTPTIRVSTGRRRSNPELTPVHFTVPAWFWDLLPVRGGNSICLGAVVLGSWTDPLAYASVGLPHAEVFKRRSLTDVLMPEKCTRNKSGVGLVVGYLTVDEVARVSEWAERVGLQWWSEACLRTLCMIGLLVPDAHKGWIDCPPEGFGVSDEWIQALQVYSGVWPAGNYMTFESMKVVKDDLEQDLQGHADRVLRAIGKTIGVGLLQRDGLTPIKQGIAKTIALYANILEHSRKRARKHVQRSTLGNQKRRFARLIAENDNAGT